MKDWEGGVFSSFLTIRSKFAGKFQFLPERTQLQSIAYLSPLLQEILKRVLKCKHTKSEGLYGN